MYSHVIHQFLHVWGIRNGWMAGMLLDDEFPIGKVRAPFPTGLVGLGFSWENKCIIIDVMYYK